MTLDMDALCTEYDVGKLSPGDATEWRAGAAEAVADYDRGGDAAFEPKLMSLVGARFDGYSAAVEKLVG